MNSNIFTTFASDLDVYSKRMKQKLNLYTILIMSYSLVVCTVYHAKFANANSKSPLFSTTPINQGNNSIYQNTKPTLLDGKEVSKKFKADIS